MSDCLNPYGGDIYIALNNFLSSISSMHTQTIVKYNSRYECATKCVQLADNGNGIYPDCGPCDIPQKVNQLNATLVNDPEKISPSEKNLLIKLFRQIIATGIADIYAIYFNFLRDAEIENSSDKPNLRALEKLAKSLDQLHPSYRFNLKPYISGSTLTMSIRDIIKAELMYETWINEYAKSIVDAKMVYTLNPNFENFVYENLFKFLVRNNSPIKNGKHFFGETALGDGVDSINFLQDFLPSLTSFLNVEYVENRDKAYTFNEYLNCLGTKPEQGYRSLSYNAWALNKQPATKITANSLSPIKFSSFKEEFDFLGYCGAYDFEYSVYIRNLPYYNGVTKEQNIKNLEDQSYYQWQKNLTMSQCSGLAQVYLAVNTQVPCSTKSYDGILPIWPEPKINDSDGTIQIQPYYLEWHNAKDGFEQFNRLSAQLKDAIEEHRSKANKELNKTLDLALTNYGRFIANIRELGNVLFNELEEKIDVLAFVYMSKNYLGINLPQDITDFLKSGYYGTAIRERQEDDFDEDDLMLKNFIERAFNFTTNVTNYSILKLSDPRLIFATFNNESSKVDTVEDLLAYQNYTTDLANLEVAIERLRNYLALLSEVGNTFHIFRDQIITIEDPSSIPTKPKIEDPKEILKTTILNFYRNFLSETIGSVLTTHHGQKILDDFHSNEGLSIDKNSSFFLLMAKQFGATNETLVQLINFFLWDISRSITSIGLKELSQIQSSITEKTILRNSVAPYDWIVSDLAPSVMRHKVDIKFYEPSELSLIDNPIEVINLLLNAVNELRVLIQQKRNEVFISITNQSFTGSDFYMDNTIDSPKYTLQNDTGSILHNLYYGETLPDYYEFVLKVLFASLFIRKVSSYSGCITIVKEASKILKNRINKKMKLPF